MTTIAPPPVPAGPPAPTEPNPPQRTSGASRVFAVIAIVVGAMIVVGTVLGAVFSTVAASSVRSESRSLTGAAVRGVDAIVVDVTAGTVQVVFADTREIELSVVSARGLDGWTFAQDGGTLQVASPRSFGPFWFGGAGRAVLTLPESLQDDTLVGDFRIAAGELDVVGDFAELDLFVGAGSVSVSGTVERVSAELNAGGATLDLVDVRDADLQVNAGALVARLTGDQPRDVAVVTNAGSLRLTVPTGDYTIRSDVSAGEFDNRIGSSPGAISTIDVTLSAGEVVLRDRG